MRKKVFILLIIFSLFLTGCNENTSKKASEENSNNEEELIWKDAAKDEIHNQRITIYDSVMIDAKFPDSEFSKDIEKLNELKETNTFAKKFLDLLDKTNIQEILDNGNSLEKYLLLSYLCIETNHNEGMGVAYNWIEDYMYVDDSDELTRVYYRKESFDNNKNFIADQHYYLPYYIFEYSTQTDSSSKLIMSLGEVSSSSNYSTISLNKEYNNVEQANDPITGKKINWIELDKDTIDKVLINNKEFLDFYIKYKNDIYYKRRDKELDISGKYSKSTETKKSAPKIGMTKSEVLNSTWGSPKKKNITETAYGTHEQWVYANGYIYFDNGVVTSISKSE